MTVLPTSVAFYEEIAAWDEADVPTKTHKIDFEKKRIVGKVDGQEAMKQAIFKILQTERYDFPKVYTDAYGVEIKDLIGLPPFIVQVQLQPLITEALFCDDRITAVSNFIVEIDKKKVLVDFTARTIFGDVEITGFEVEV